MGTSLDCSGKPVGGGKEIQSDRTNTNANVSKNRRPVKDNLEIE
ncbi:hypothetical protein [Nostoc sp. DedSLP04]|nr:hypothetical protein [Nostoc sp. DedSLP04]MDZ8032018.1 hypothetical protein [Nostoc sp. DedSLP04]